MFCLKRKFGLKEAEAAFKRIASSVPTEEAMPVAKAAILATLEVLGIPNNLPQEIKREIQAKKNSMAEAQQVFAATIESIRKDIEDLRKAIQRAEERKQATAEEHKKTLGLLERRAAELRQIQKFFA